MKMFLFMSIKILHAVNKDWNLAVWE